MTLEQKVSKTCGPQAAQVWAYLQSYPLVDSTRVAKGTGIARPEVENALVRLALAGFLAKLTPEGLAA
jgi:hypothetical protein